MPTTLTDQKYVVFNGYTTDSSGGIQAIATLDVVGEYNYTINEIP
ncbi:MAG: hypothetical protein P8M66_07855 [Flavobacteriaceae bacterium]|jgi:hypothetical protein|nr:hypothetical protein [Flavobacteriaceae bacterium]MDG2499406.1 hypothetical protein [Flavobacteriaceae bacterium]